VILGLFMGQESGQIALKSPPWRGFIQGGQSTAVPIPYKIALGIPAAQNLMAEVEWNQRQI